MSTQVLDDDDVERYANECVLYILSQHYKNTSIKRTDIIKSIIPDQGRRNVKLVLNQAKEILKSTYGLLLHELEDSCKQYLVINNLDPSTNIEPKWDSKTAKQQTLLLPILSVIFMNGNSISEDELWAFLKRLRIIEGSSRCSEYFGNLEDFIKKDLTNQRYLIYEAEQNNEMDGNKTYIFKWGKRAELEVRKDLILKHICDMLKCEMSQLAEQYAEITVT